MRISFLRDSFRQRSPGRGFREPNGQLYSHTDLVTRPVSKAHTSWYHQDMRSSTMMLSSVGGRPMASYAYDAFGMLFGDHPRAQMGPGEL